MNLYNEFNQPLMTVYKSKIHPTAIISSSAIIGKGNIIGPYTVIHDGVEIGDNNYIAGHCSIGSPAEHKDELYNPIKEEQHGKVFIGSHNVIREFATINKPTLELTKIGNHCYLMRNFHAGHDVIVHDHVITSCDVVLGGHTIVLEGAYLGIKSCTHPRLVVGHYSMIGMGSVLTKNAEPVGLYYGVPAKYKGKNEVGIERNKLTDLKIEEYMRLYKQITQED